MSHEFTVNAIVLPGTEGRMALPQLGLARRTMELTCTGLWVWGDQRQIEGPMQGGLLADKFSRERVESLPEDGWRRRSPDFTTDLDRNLGPADAPRAIAGRHRVTQAAVVVARALARPSHRGNRRCPQPRPGRWLPAASLQLTHVTSMRRGWHHAHGRGSGPARAPLHSWPFNLRRVSAIGRQT
jgi:hypothetical protein